MKPNLAITFHYIIMLSLAIFPGTANSGRDCIQAKDIKVEKPHTSIARENTAEVLHSEILFRY